MNAHTLRRAAHAARAARPTLIPRLALAPSSPITPRFLASQSPTRPLPSTFLPNPPRAPRLRLAALLALSAAACSTLAVADAAPPAAHLPLSPLSRAELETGVPFPLALPSGAALHATGVRLMGGLVRVYALGLYADPDALRAALADWRGFTKHDILAAPPLWRAVCNPAAPYERTFRMVIVREVAGKHMCTGFERALAPRVTKEAKKGRCRPAECKKAVKDFGALFAGVGTMKVGSDVRIVVGGGGVRVEVDGRDLGGVRNELLAWAVADMFLGEKAVTPTLREAAADQFEQLLRD